MASTNIATNVHGAPSASTNPLPPHIPFNLPRSTRFLAVFNVPSDFSFLDAMRYLRITNPRHGWRGIRRVIRTIEAGEHIIWVGFSSKEAAYGFREKLHQRYISGFPPFVVEFVHGDVYSARASWAKESWSRKTGLTLPPQSGVSSRIHSGQMPPPANFFEMPSLDDWRLFTELADVTILGYQSRTPYHYKEMACQHVRSNSLLYERLKATTPPDDDTILTRRQRRDRERWREYELDDKDSISSPPHEQPSTGGPRAH